ncbi:MAG: DNA-binding protein [Candidatus Aenigmatarchaeota archaeon]
MEVSPEQLEAMKKEILRKILDKDAFERMSRVKMANPMLASQLEVYLIQLFQSGQLKETITDEKLKNILNTLTEKRKTKIRRR